MTRTVHFSDWETFILLLWKNWSITWNNKSLQILSICMPAIFCASLVALRFRIDVDRIPAVHYEPINLEEAWTNLFKVLDERQKDFSKALDEPHSVFTPQFIIAYAPKSEQGYTNIMEAAMKELQPATLLAFENCQTLRREMMLHNYFAGICFNDIIPTISTDTIHKVGIYPNRLQFDMVFPSELRIYKDSYITSHWNTNIRTANTYSSRNREPKANDGGFVGYCREGFITLQDSVSRAYIKLIANLTTMPTVQIQRFPFRQWDDDYLSSQLNKCLHLIIVAGYIFPLAIFTKHVVSERQSETTNLLQMIGVPYWLNVCAWFVYGVAALTVSSILVIIALNIHWNCGYAILSKSSITALFFFFIPVNMASISFCLMVSACHKQSTAAVIMVCILSFFTYLPYQTLRHDNLIPKWVSYACVNTVLSIALRQILDFENFSEGFDWSCLSTKDDRMVGALMIILLGLAIVYGMIGLCIERALLNMPQIFSKFCMRFRDEKFDRRRRRRQTNATIRRTKVIEVETISTKCTLSINEVTKTFSGVRVVKKVSLNLYEDTVTVLMGHNGSGKTTLLAMTTGLERPTMGTISLNDTTEEGELRQITMGIYLKTSSLFDNLTVANQIFFFSRIRGLNARQSQEEVHKFMTAMGLNDHRNVLTRNLSSGLRQHLAVCCALVGDTKIVILDDPCKHMDLFGQKLFCKLILEEKMGRTIFMSTHSLREAHLLADRVAFMANGELKYCGSTQFLKKIYGQSYHLVCFEGPHCKSEDVTKIVLRHVPHVIATSHLGSELTYVIGLENLEFVCMLLDEIEEKSEQLGLESFQISESSLEDIFHQLGAEDPSDGDSERQSEIMNGHSIYMEEYRERGFLKRHMRLTGIDLLLNHWWALMLKRVLYVRQYLTHSFVKILMPVFVVLLTLSILQGHWKRRELPLLVYNLEVFRGSTTIVDVSQEESHKEHAIWERYKHIIEKQGDPDLVEMTEKAKMERYILHKLESKEARINNRYYIGATFNTDEITAWFGNHPLHSAPVSLNIVYNAILHYYLMDDNGHINITLHPLPFSTNTPLMLADVNYSTGNILAINIVVCMCFVWPFCVVFAVDERTTGFKLMQIISGCHISTYWAASFFYECIITTFTAMAIMLPILLIDSENFRQIFVALWYFLILLLSGITTFSVFYLISFFTNEPDIAFAFGVTFGLFGTISYVSMLYILNTGYSNVVEGQAVIEWIFRIVPHFSICNALIKVFKTGVRVSICKDELINFLSKYEECLIAPRCCGRRDMLVFERRSGDFGLNTDLICLLFIFTASWLLLARLEYKNHYQTGNFFSGKVPDDNKVQASEEYRRHHGSLLDDLPKELVDELTKVQSLRPKSMYNKPLVCDRVSKFYKRAVGIKRLYLAIERAECVGLPNIATSNVTTIFRVITGYEKMSYGNVYVNSYSLKETRYKMYEHIGYCPEYNAIPMEFSPNDTLLIIGLLRGIPPDIVDELSESLAKVLGFYDHRRKILKVCSKGIRRRVSFAVATMNCPEMLLLDGFSSAVDPSGKRQLWYIMDQLRQHCGCSVLFSTLDPYEIEALCTRLLVIVNGEPLTIGTPWDLRNKFGNAYLLLIKMKQIAKEKTRLSMNVASFVETEFPKSVLRSYMSHILLFIIPIRHNKLSRVFQVMERNSFSLYIEAFRIFCESFSSVLMDILEDEEYTKKRQSDDTTTDA